MGRFKGTKGSILLVIMVLLVMSYYFYLSNRTNVPEQKEKSISAAQEVLLRNMEENYPPSPKEVVKYFCEITKCFYEQEYKEEELKALALQIRKLYDVELVANQTEEEYLTSLQFDIKSFADKGYRISNYEVASSTSVEYYTVDGFQFAKLNANFIIRQNKSARTTSEKFLLRKDEADQWKIYGWDMIDKADELQDE